VIHTVGPMYYSEGHPASVLAKAYKSSVSVAVNHGVKYIAFPAISCGVYGYPYDEAAEVSVQALQDSAGQLSEVHFVLFEAGTYSAWLAEAKKKLERLPA
jgi:O-acetyl-ADP-ribose deacetylase (regulator of RNase III)